TSLHWRLLVLLEEGAEASVWHESTSAHQDAGGPVHRVGRPHGGAPAATPCRSWCSAPPRGFASSTTRRWARGRGSSARSARPWTATAGWTGSRSASARATARGSRGGSRPG